jgi:putative Mg2+ transporter-C (MgtC) family protein
MRTHLLVAVGCCLFTELSIYGFNDLGVGSGTANPDPTRIAAQIVTGIGFLGAGAIIKYGTSIHGLTTAASLWATAAVGLGIGTGQYIISVVGTAIIIFSLWPLNRLGKAVGLRNPEALHVTFTVERLDALSEVYRLLRQRELSIDSVKLDRADGDKFAVMLDLKVPMGVSGPDIVTTLDGVDGVQLVSSGRITE